MTPALVLAILGVFVMAALVAGWGTATWLAVHDPGQRRLQSMLQPLSVPAAAGVKLSEGPDPLLAKFSRLMPRSPADLNRLQLRLARAGLRVPHAALYFSAAEILLPAGLGLAAFAWFGMSQWPYVLGAVALGFALPEFFVSHHTKRRQRLIRNGLPDALDLITLCVEAGNGLDQAIAKAGQELQIAHPVLADELRLITTETRAGKARLDAFRNFAVRTGVEDVQTLVSMLIQTDRFGTSVGQALRTHAETSRTKRRQMAEERAGRVGVKLVFPLALCLMPALFVVAFGSIALKIYRTLIVGQ